jgi:hypothetical protein
MRTALLFISDGRTEYHELSWRSAMDNLPAFDEYVAVEDPDHSKGFCGAIREGWDHICGLDVDYVFHLELDFTFNEPVNFDEMVDLLERNVEVAQVSLKRQPVNEREREAGGIVEADPDDFVEASDEYATWTEHRRYFTTNPSIYRASLCRLGWPQEAESEGKFTHRLLRDPLLRFAIWGGKHDPPKVQHIGEVRAGALY